MKVWTTLLMKYLDLMTNSSEKEPTLSSSRNQQMMGSFKLNSSPIYTQIFQSMHQSHLIFTILTSSVTLMKKRMKRWSEWSQILKLKLLKWLSMTFLKLRNSLKKMKVKHPKVVLKTRRTIPIPLVMPQTFQKFRNHQIQDKYQPLRREIYHRLIRKILLLLIKKNQLNQGKKFFF